MMSRRSTESRRRWWRHHRQRGDRRHSLRNYISRRRADHCADEREQVDEPLRPVAEADDDAAADRTDDLAAEPQHDGHELIPTGFAPLTGDDLADLSGQENEHQNFEHVTSKVG